MSWFALGFCLANKRVVWSVVCVCSLSCKFLELNHNVIFIYKYIYKIVTTFRVPRKYLIVSHFIIILQIQSFKNKYLPNGGVEL